MNGVRPAELTGELQGTLLKPQFSNGLGVVVLAGSSGRVDVARANLFAMTGNGPAGRIGWCRLIPLTHKHESVRRI